SLAGWGTPWGFTSPRLVMPGVETVCSTDDRGNHVTETRCARGTLTARVSPHGHPIAYPLKDAADVRLYLARWEEASWEEADDREAYAHLAADIGADGVATQFFGPSVIPWLLENLAGVETFYYLLADEPDLLHALITLMQEKERARFAIAARHPCPLATLVENTSTAYISPAVYARYNMPSQRAFVEAMHREGRTALIHMCGHVRGLLPLIKETGLDGIHTLTPPPLGDCPWELALDVLGDDLIILGCLPPHCWVLPDPAEIGPALDRLITPRLRAARFVLNPMADGIAVPLDRFLAVGAWVAGH
ncbi:MAG TPA: uroporphyrinogen decarboxylase family protein, partial [Armatimonadota bacterium]|nr:uroporphyrinogen decarboxylase family protein [Armatimonadota bacterium]